MSIYQDRNDQLKRVVSRPEIAENKASVWMVHAMTTPFYFQIKISEVQIKKSHIQIKKGHIQIKKCHIQIKKSHIQIKKKHIQIKKMQI